MRYSILTALFVFLALAGYFTIRTLTQPPSEAARANGQALSVAEREAEQNKTLPKVVIREVFARPHDLYLTLSGRTAANRTVTVRAATSGTVIEAPQLEGKSVPAGRLLCRLDVETRQAVVREAEARLKAQQVDYDAARTLTEKGWASANRINAARANLEAAEAGLDSAQIELKRTQIQAPFSGIFETRLAEKGDFLTPGGACGLLTDLDPLIIETQVSETYAQILTEDSPVTVRILNGAALPGKITYVARTADPATRTFQVKISLANEGFKRPAGLTSHVRIGLGQSDATLLSAALLTLNDAGVLGIRHLDAQNRVIFTPVNVVDEAADGVWVTGLAARTRAISVGQEYIQENIIARPVREEDL